MINYLRKILNDKCFGEPSDYSEIIKLLNKDYYNNTINYSSRLIRNFYNILDIEIPPDFMELIKEDLPLYKSMQEIPLLYNKEYFKETPLTISIDELYEEFHYLNETKTSQYLYYINIINYSTFCVKQKSIIDDYNCLDVTFKTLKSNQVIKLLNNLLQYIINALETFNYNEILILYKEYISLSYQIYYPDDKSKQLFGGDTKPLHNPINDRITPLSNIRNWLSTNNVFFYSTFNTVNEIQFSLFEFTNIVLVTINEEKPIHGALNGMIWNLQHDVVVHFRLIRASNTSLIESNRLYTLLKYIYVNECDKDLYIFPWGISNECAQSMGSIYAQQIYPFSLYDLRRMFKLRKGIPPSLTLYKYLMIPKLLLLLKKIGIINFDDKIPQHFNIIDEKWKYVHKEYTDDERATITRNTLIQNLTIKKRYVNESDFLIEEIKTDSIIYMNLQKDKQGAIERAIERYKQKNIIFGVRYEGRDIFQRKYLNYDESRDIDPRSDIFQRKYLNYKQKYLKLKNSNK